MGGASGSWATLEKMGANPSTPEEPPPPPRGESPWQLPFLGALGHRPDPKPPVPELPDEIERMIHAYVMQERARERRSYERRVNDVLEFREQRRAGFYKNVVLSDFCQLIDDKSFRWLTNEYLKGKPEEAPDRCPERVSWYMNNKRGLSEIREELRAGGAVAEEAEQRQQRVRRRPGRSCSACWRRCAIFAKSAIASTNELI